MKKYTVTDIDETVVEILALYEALCEAVDARDNLAWSAEKGRLVATLLSPASIILADIKRNG